jgi:hypothetical protein
VVNIVPNATALNCFYLHCHFRSVHCAESCATFPLKHSLRLKGPPSWLNAASHPYNRTKTRWVSPDRATEHPTRLASLVTCICPQGQRALQFLYCHFHILPSGVYAEHCPRTCFCQIGREDFDALRPIVTPFLGPADRDISQMTERRATSKHSGILPTALRLSPGSTIVTGLGQRLDQSTEMPAIGTFPGPWQRKHLGMVCLCHPLQCRIGSTTRIGNHDHLANSGRGKKCCSICQNRLF